MRHYLILILSIFLLLPKALEGKSSLVGTTLSQHKQNERAEADGLPQVKDDKELTKLKEMSVLVKIPRTVRIDPKLEEKWRWCLPHTSYFLGDIGLEFEEIFKKKLQVNSAVRTAVRQKELMLTNNNAVPTTGPRRSSHLTGATVDIAKIGLSKIELEWMRKKLLSLESEDRLEATEENDQLVFHVMVFTSYQPKEVTELRAQ